MINDELTKLYSRFWSWYSENCQGGKIMGVPVTNPYLLKVSEKWEAARIKIMVLGMETNYWATELSDVNVSSLMNHYNKFVIEDWGDNYQFWQFVSTLREWSRDCRHSDIAFIPNNVSKIGRPGKGTDDSVFNAVIDNVNLVRKEIDIIHPDMLLILTVSYDNYLKAVLGNYTATPIDNVQRMSWLELQELNIPCLRCPHPLSLSFNNSWNETVCFIENIIDLKFAGGKKEGMDT